MREAVTLNGMVLLSAPSGEFDRRLVLLTTGRGKITAFAHGARRPGNPLMACTRTFVFGKFTLYEYVLLCPVEALYRFALTDEVLREFERVVESGRRRFLRHECRSLEILEVLTSD